MGRMLGGPDESDATDPNDPPDAAMATLVGRAATVAPDIVATTAIVISAAAKER
jgi:hypothetical protein